MQLQSSFGAHCHWLTTLLHLDLYFLLLQDELRFLFRLMGHTVKYLCSYTTVFHGCHGVHCTVKLTMYSPTKELLKTVALSLSQ